MVNELKFLNKNPATEDPQPPGVRRLQLLAQACHLDLCLRDRTTAHKYAMQGLGNDAKV